MYKIKEFGEFINEGAIGDIIKRAASDEIREENDIDNMGMEDFLEYIKENYEFRYGCDVWLQRESSIQVPLFSFFNIFANYDKDKKRIISITIEDGGNKWSSSDLLAEFKKELANEFGTVFKRKRESYYVNSIDAKYVSNSTVIKIMDISLKYNQTGREIIISKKKDDINEGVIGDIIKRAASDETRVEDNLDLKNIDELQGYIKDTFNFKTHKWYSDEKKSLYLECSLRPIHAWIEYKHGNVHTIYLKTEDWKRNKFIGDIANKFNMDLVKEDEDETYTAYWDWGSKQKPTNTKFIELLKFISKSGRINEGAIGDIIKRAASDETRLEDNIDKLSIDEFYSYIKENFNCKTNSYHDKYMIYKYIECISNAFHVWILFKSKKINAIWVEVEDDIIGFRNLVERLSKKFKIDTTEEKNTYSAYISNECKLTNTKFINFLKCVLELDKVNEGAIGDIIKRASSSEERIEDSLDTLSLSDFCSYITSNFDCRFGRWDDLIKVCLGGGWFYLDASYEGDQIKKIWIESSRKCVAEDIVNKFNLQSTGAHANGISYWNFTDKKEISNTKFIEILKYALRLNEGAIGDIIKRAASDETRIEDKPFIQTSKISEYNEDVKPKEFDVVGYIGKSNKEFEFRRIEGYGIVDKIDNDGIRFKVCLENDTTDGYVYINYSIDNSYYRMDYRKIDKNSSMFSTMESLANISNSVVSKGKCKPDDEDKLIGYFDIGHFRLKE